MPICAALVRSAAYSAAETRDADGGATDGGRVAGRAAAFAPTRGESVSHERALQRGGTGTGGDAGRTGCRGVALTKRLSEAKTWLAPNLSNGAGTRV